MLTNYLLIIAKTFLLSYVITEFSPLKWLLDLLPANMFKYVIVLLTSCLSCCSFWLSLAIFHDIWIASLSYFIGDLFNRFIKHHIQKIMLQ